MKSNKTKKNNTNNFKTRHIMLPSNSIMTIAEKNFITTVQKNKRFN